MKKPVTKQPIQMKDKTKGKPIARHRHRPNKGEIATRDSTRESVVPADAPQWVLPWLAALEITGVVTAACRAVGIASSTPYHWFELHPEYKYLWDESERISRDALVLEARRRAIEGTQKTVYQKGIAVGTEQVYSDNLLLALLKAKFPEEFADRFVIKLSPNDASVLKYHGLTPDTAWSLFVAELQQDRDDRQRAMSVPDNDSPILIPAIAKAE